MRSIFFFLFHALICDAIFSQELTYPGKLFSLFANRDLDIFLNCDDTVGLDQSNWITLTIKNKSTKTIIIEDFNYDWLGQGNKFDVFEYYYNHDNPSDKNDIQLLPDSSLTSSRFISDYGLSSMAHEMEEKKYCNNFKIELKYLLDGKTKSASISGIPICFIWRPVTKLDEDLLVQRLKREIANPYDRSAYTYILWELTKNQNIISKLSNEELIAGIETASPISISLLRELNKSINFPIPVLSDYYKADLISKSYNSLEDLSYYWDIDLLEYLLAIPGFHWNIIQILDRQSSHWSKDHDHTTSVFQYLKSKTGIDIFKLPIQNNFVKWADGVKLISISRDSTVIQYLSSLLDNEDQFLYPDWSPYKYSSMAPKNGPDSMSIRICDIAYIGLLRAADQLSYKFNESDYTYSLRLKEEILDPALLYKINQSVPSSTLPLPSSTLPLPSSTLFDLSYIEKFVRLTPEGKARMLNYIAHIK